MKGKSSGGKPPRGPSATSGRGPGGPTRRGPKKTGRSERDRKTAPWLPAVAAPIARPGKAGKPAAHGAPRSRPPEMPAPRDLDTRRGAPRPTEQRRPAPHDLDTRRGATRPTEPRRPAPHAGEPRVDKYASRESERYEQPIASRESIIEFLSDSTQLMTAEKIGESLGLTDPYRFDALVKRLSAMVRDGQLLVNRRGGYGVAQRLDLIPGEILANADGYGFLRPDDGSEDLYISPAQMRVVLHGDRVLASVVGLDRRGRREGAVVEVLERRAARLVGRYQEQDGFGLVVPDDRRIHQDLLIPHGRHERARTGQIVVAEIMEPPTRERPPVGRVVAVLGERLTASLTVRMAIESHGLPNEFPGTVLREVESVEPEVSKKERAGRIDLREVPLVTIDGEDARDFDDAVWCERKKSGFRLIVAIADVSHYVRPGTALDDEAYNRATSVYFPDFVVPMLPEMLSNGICSLNPKVDRLCMVCDMQVGHDGEVKSSEFYQAVMRSHARLTYTEVWKAIGDKDRAIRDKLGYLLPHIEDLHALYKSLAIRRRKRGAIDFDSQEVKFRLAPSGEVLAMGAYERNDAHKLIEECMIAANVEAARYIEKKGIPAPFRVHAMPPAEKYEDLVEFMKEFGFRLPPHSEVKPAHFAELIEKVRDRPDANLLQSVLLRSQSLAIYHPENGGHFGLALDAYAHFTSPIRRYPDLMLHRAINYAIAGGKKNDYIYSEGDMTMRAAHCSANERRADFAEREVDERFKCAWMEKHIGTEFDGVVSGVTSFGLFVELIESRVTGLVHVTQLPNDYYHFDAKRHIISGERRGLKFRLGDKVRVLVLRASLEDRKIDFRLVHEQQAAEPSDADTGATLRRPHKPRAPEPRDRERGREKPRRGGGAGARRGR